MSLDPEEFSREFGRNTSAKCHRLGGGEKKDRVGRTVMFTVNFSWTSESAVYRSAGVKAAWTERARHACAHVAVPEKARVRSRGFKLTGPDRMSVALRGRHVSHTRAKNTYTLERT